jgi:hypothetical protein
MLWTADKVRVVSERIRSLFSKQIPQLREDMIPRVPNNLRYLPATLAQFGKYVDVDPRKYTYVVRYRKKWKRRITDMIGEGWILDLNVRDDYLEKYVWSRLQDFVKEVKTSGCKMVFSTYFTVHMDDPLPVYVYNVWRTRFVERFMQDNGIMVVPNMIFSPYWLIFSMGLPPRVESLCTVGVSTKSRIYALVTVYERFAEYVSVGDMVWLSAPNSRSQRSEVLRACKARRHIFLSTSEDFHKYFDMRRKEMIEQVVRKNWGSVPVSRV